ncbi:MAG: hypothetical protein ACRENU_10230 [Gemmatimonadaceae bacterium]
MLRNLMRLTAAMVVLTACDNTSANGLIGVTPPPTQLVFLTQPTDVAAQNPIIPSVRIGVQNANGQISGSGSVAVTISLVPGTGAPGASLIGGAASNTFNGIVLFANLRIDTPGAGYQLLASATGFPSVASAPFNVTP